MAKQFFLPCLLIGELSAHFSNSVQTRAEVLPFFAEVSPFVGVVKTSWVELLPSLAEVKPSWTEILPNFFYIGSSISGEHET